MWVVGFAGEKVVEAEVEVEEVVVFIAERRGLPCVAQGIFFGRPLLHCPFSSLGLYTFPSPLGGLI